MHNYMLFIFINFTPMDVNILIHGKSNFYYILFHN